MKNCKINLLYSPNLKKLIKLQSQIGLIFSLLVLILYFSFIIIVGFNPSFFSVSFGDSLINVGIIFGISLIIFSILLTITYVIIANYKLDKIRKKIKKHEL